ncbi:hypothetical protein HPP92_015993 [Vanilla planifolia]|uniref:Uncharacterized protein n=1 Tax=Vanilla planifolia TaxID=51239 RepID=A0A835QNC0_VANPL|nr:hypothetical protein HPP92_015993 [Vanilla planifolia]
MKFGRNREGWKGGLVNEKVCFPDISVFVKHGLAKDHIHQLAECLPGHSSFLPNDISDRFMGYASLLSNLLENCQGGFV